MRWFGGVQTVIFAVCVTDVNVWPLWTFGYTTGVNTFAQIVKETALCVYQHGICRLAGEGHSSARAVHILFISDRKSVVLSPKLVLGGRVVTS